ncbi:MAG TPA: hypothetical protein VHC63_00265 [Acidimicrobiales bacterium]|nr:hypothetical protein [Acidimicrobiales bacterium]
MARTLTDLVVPFSGYVGRDQFAFAKRALLGVGNEVEQAVLDLRDARGIDLSTIDSLLDAAEVLQQRGVRVVVEPGWARDALHLTGHAAMTEREPA